MNTDRAQIFAGVIHVLTTHLNVTETLHLGTRIEQDLALDSVGKLTFVVELENYFQVCMAPEDEEHVRTLGDVVELLARS